MAPTLGYWHIRGLANQIRLVLKYNEVDFEDKTYSLGAGAGSEWFDKDKKELGLDLPNLPYWIDGDLKLTETNAIMYHFGRKYKMIGSTEEESCRHDMIFHYNGDVRMSMVRTFYNPDFENVKQGLLDSLDARLTKYAALLGDRTWFIGEKLTISDVSVYDVLDIMRNFSEGCLQKYPKLEAFMKRFEELPTIKAYLESDDRIKGPFNGSSAKWGNK